MQQDEKINKLMKEYDRWWIKWHQTLIIGATTGIILDVIGLYFLFTSELSSLFFNYILAVAIGVLIGFSIILFFATNRRLRIKYVKFAVTHFGS